MQWECSDYEEARRAIEHMRRERGGANRNFEIRSLYTDSYGRPTKAVALVEVQNPRNEEGRQ